MSRPSEHEQRFIGALDRLIREDDRAALAALRRGLGKPAGEAAESFRYVVPWLPASAPRWQEDAYFLVAALFAWHQGHWQPGDGDRVTNLGASFQRLVVGSGAGSAEQRFVALLNSHRDDLPEHLRHAVGLLKSKEVPIDWAQLLHDVQHWDWEGRPIQREWARAFWGRQASTAAASAANAAAQ